MEGHNEACFSQSLKGLWTEPGDCCCCCYLLATLSTAVANRLPESVHNLAAAANAELQGGRARRNFWRDKAGGDQGAADQLANAAYAKRPGKVGNAPPNPLLKFCSDELLEGALVRWPSEGRGKVPLVLEALRNLKEVQDSKHLRELAAAAHYSKHATYKAIEQLVRRYEKKQWQEQQ